MNPITTPQSDTLLVSSPLLESLAHDWKSIGILERGRVIGLLMNDEHQLTSEMIADAVEITPQTVRNYRRVNLLPAALKDLIDRGTIGLVEALRLGREGQTKCALVELPVFDDQAETLGHPAYGPALHRTGAETTEPAAGIMNDLQDGPYISSINPVGQTILFPAEHAEPEEPVFEAPPEKAQERKDEVFEKNSWSINLQSSRVKNYDQLVAACNVDLTLWDCPRFEVSSYEVTYVPRATRDSGKKKWIRPDTKAITVPMWTCKAVFVRKQDVARNKAVVDCFKDEFEDLLSRINVKIITRAPSAKGLDTGYVLEVNIADQHFGKLGWSKETLEPNSDLEITAKQWRRAVEYILEDTAHKRFDEIIFVVGNDISQVDNHKRETTHGTTVDSDSRYAKIYARVFAEVVWAIKMCQQYCPKVHIVIVPGNHDMNTCFTLGFALGLVFDGDPNVTIDNGPCPKKVYKFGKCLVGWEHGHERARRREIALNLAVDFPSLWGQTEFREIHTGHEHHLEVEDVQSVIVRRVASLTSNDYWHHTSGYIAQRATEAFLFHKDRGLQSTHMYVESRQRPLLQEVA